MYMYIYIQDANDCSSYLILVFFLFFLSYSYFRPIFFVYSLYLIFFILLLFSYCLLLFLLSYSYLFFLLLILSSSELFRVYIEICIYIYIHIYIYKPIYTYVYLLLVVLLSSSSYSFLIFILSSSLVFLLTLYSSSSPSSVVVVVVVTVIQSPSRQVLIGQLLGAVVAVPSSRMSDHVGCKPAVYVSCVVQCVTCPRWALIEMRPELRNHYPSLEKNGCNECFLGPNGEYLKYLEIRRSFLKILICILVLG